MRNNKVTALVFLVVAAAFIFGVVNLFHIRFQSGDMYPVYSSLRSDPLGTKIMFEGLNQIQGVSAVRNYHPLHKISHDPETTFLFLGMQTENFNTFNKKAAEKLEAIATEGGRVAMTFLPGRKPDMKCITKKEESCNTEPEDEQQDTVDDKEKINEKDFDKDKDGPVSYVDLAEHWGVAIEYHDSTSKSDKGSQSESVLTTDSHDLPDTISWHSRSYFRTTDSEWNEIYTVEGRPVLIERNFSHGKIILSSDSYFVSNEAMLKERHPDLLSWIIGENRLLLFDETHHGIIEQPNLASLARKYRLHGLFGALLFIAALFIWKNSTSFMPPDKNLAEETVQDSSKDNLSGLVNLLRRNIKNSDILDVCFHEWEKTTGQRYHTANDMKRIKEIIEKDKKIPLRQRSSQKSYRINKPYS